MLIATRSSGVPEIGALYASSRATQHGCTASVVHSPRGNTLITAAHCVVGNGAGMVFVPGQRGGQTPYGRWTVTAAYVEPKWVTRQDPDADVAFLTVAPRTINGASTQIEQVTGAYALGPAAGRGQRVTITGYPGGGPNYPISCAAKVYLTQTFPSFDCRGFVGGTSGSPWSGSSAGSTRAAATTTRPTARDSHRTPTLPTSALWTMRRRTSLRRRAATDADCRDLSSSRWGRPVSGSTTKQSRQAHRHGSSAKGSGRSPGSGGHTPARRPSRCRWRSARPRRPRGWWRRRS